MGNTMKGRRDGCVLGVFDLKGSMVNRFVKVKDGKPLKPTQTLKDINLLQAIKDDNPLTKNTERIRFKFTKKDRV